MFNLNEYEKPLIQRAKSFQVVQTMGTIGKKNMPHREMNKKVVGRAFHLPLPIGEIFKKVRLASEPLNRENELHILVRGIPTKSKNAWDNLVHIQKVFHVRVWLKQNNPLYCEIILPQSLQQTLQRQKLRISYPSMLLAECQRKTFFRYCTVV